MNLSILIRYFNRTFILGALLCGASILNAQERSIRLGKGQLVSFIASKMKTGMEEKRNLYFSKVFPSAKAYGFKKIGAFDILKSTTETRGFVQNFQSGDTLELFSWTNQKAYKDFEKRTTDWSKMKAMRPEIWEELRIQRMPVQKDATLTFKKNKVYRFVSIWLNKDKPEDLQAYLDSVKETRENLGGKYLIEWKGVGHYHSLAEPDRIPDRVWIIEWPNDGSHERYLQSEAFRQNVRLFASGVSKFDAFETTFRF